MIREEETCATLCAEINAVPVLDFHVAQQVGRLAKDLSSSSSDERGEALLTRLRDACRDSNVQAMILNNLACVEKKRGKLEDSLMSLKQAVKLEGGMARALPTTLVNLSAALFATNRFSESAAVAHKAVERCLAHRPSSPSNVLKGSSNSKVLAAAYFNFAVALESTSEQPDVAEQAYRDVLQLVEPHDPYAKAAQSALNALLLRNQAAFSEKWSSTVQRSVADQIRATNKNAQDASFKKRPHAKTPPLSILDKTSHQRSATSTALSTSVAKRASSSNTSVLLNTSGIRDDISRVYAEPIRKYHSLPPLLSPIPYEDRSPKRMLSELQNTSPYGVSTQTCATHPDMPDWNADPVLETHALSYRIALPAEKKQWALIHEVEVRFIPKALVPLVEDIRYKENTRRTMIVKEWKRRFDIIVGARALATFSGEEDAQRVAIEMEQARVRRLLRQWITGKLLFAEATLRLEREESLSREACTREMLHATHALQSHGNRLHPQALEEVERAKITLDMRTEYSALQIDRDASTTTVQSRASLRQNVTGIAYALALWCLEGVLPEGELHKIEDPSRKSSISVMERYAVFGRPKRQNAAAVPQTPTSSSSS